MDSTETSIDVKVTNWEVYGLTEGMTVKYCQQVQDGETLHHPYPDTLYPDDYMTEYDSQEGYSYLGKYRVEEILEVFEDIEDFEKSWGLVMLQPVAVDAY